MAENETLPKTMTLGWREWVALPELGIPAIKAKLDTGARTSALHAFDLEAYRENGIYLVRFGIHPLQKRLEPAIYCTSNVIDYRKVTDSGGHMEERYVISTNLSIAGRTRTIELTLTNRETMNFRMLLGRTAMKHLIRVDPAKSFVLGRELAGLYFNPTSQGRPN